MALRIDARASRPDENHRRRAMAHALEGGERFSERAAALGERGAQLVLVGKQPLQATLSLIDVALELGHLLAGVDSDRVRVA